MKKDWILEAKTRIGQDYEYAGGAMITQRAMVSKFVRKNLKFSKTQLEGMVGNQEAWMRAKLSRLNILEVLLERRRLLGKVVWWLYRRMLEDLKKPAMMRPVPGAAQPAKQKAAEGEWNAVAREIS
jgi:hypothetical protein